MKNQNTCQHISHFMRLKTLTLLAIVAGTTTFASQAADLSKPIKNSTGKKGPIEQKVESNKSSSSKENNNLVYSKIKNIKFMKGSYDVDERFAGKDKLVIKAEGKDKILRQYVFWGEDARKLKGQIKKGDEKYLPKRGANIKELVSTDHFLTKNK
jgi:hypothetical protein